MRNSTSFDCEKQKLPIFKRIRIAVKRNSGKTDNIVPCVPLDQIFHDTAINKKIDFVAKRISGGNLKRNENVIFNGSSSINASSLKPWLTFSSELNEIKYETSKIRSCRILNKHRKNTRILKRSFVADEPNSAFRQVRCLTGNNTEEKSDFKYPPKTGVDFCQERVGKKKPRNEFSSVVQGPVDALKKTAESFDPSTCVVEEVLGNSVTTFSNSDDVTFYDDENVTCLDTRESQLIVPKKTDDITKIKGWRRKQFFVEKPTTIEFQEFPYINTTAKKISVGKNHSKAMCTSPKSHVENAFVCDSLDKFLERDAELKINYEIPHLFAEVGIKLTKEEIASSPSLSEKDIKEVETKYCRQIPSHNDVFNLDDIKAEKIKRGKRPIEDDAEESFKLMKLENNNIRLVRNSKRSNDKQGNKCTPAVKQESLADNKDDSRTSDVSKIKLTSKVLGLVVYPTPHKPLHPIVQFHLRKLRSYHTAIDENWANFAASVVVRKDSKYERCILPATCCVKVIRDSVSCTEEIANISATVLAAEITKTESPNVEEAKNTEKSKEDCSLSRVPNTKIYSTEELKRMKDCRVVIEKLDIGPGSTSLCSKHHRCNCKNCFPVKKEPDSIMKPVSAETEENITIKQEECERPVPILSEPGFYEDITNLLAKKLKIFHPDTLTSIDSLKTLNLNAVELIKLRFIQKSFLHNYISIWYLKPQMANVRSRAFLTFSKTPPVPDAINLRCGLVVNNLPKVIREIVQFEKCVDGIDTDEYVLLYCNGNYWEIHGSVNVAFNKRIKTTEQVIISAELQELKNLQDMSHKMPKVKAVKWWVLDLSQAFRTIELKWKDLIASISHKKLLEFIKTDTSGFMPLRTNSEGRIFGAYMIQSLLPYVLVGPYQLFEIPSMTLKGDFSTLPFAYNEAEDAKESGHLKFHISSTIKKTKESGKTVESLWLHHMAFSGHSVLLEVMTAFDVYKSSRPNYSISDEHGYSLNSVLLPDVKQKHAESQHGDLQVEVYLYFNIFGLGYVLGVLEKDNSVTIVHPLNERTKVNSTEIGTWFLGIVRRRILFVPKNLVVHWFVTRHKSQLKNRQPFNKNLLNGAHILTDSGVFYVLKLTNSNQQGSILKKRNILEAACKGSVIEEVVYLKILSDLLFKRPKIKPSMDKVLHLAVKEITKLQKKLKLLERLKACLEQENLRLFTTFLTKIHLKGFNKKLSIILLKRIEDLIFSESGKIREVYLKKLALFSFGRYYLKSVEKRKIVDCDMKPSSNNLGFQSEWKELQHFLRCRTQ